MNKEQNKELELRMYFFVPYNISSIQKGIQAGHASDQYNLKFQDDQDRIDFVKIHRTWIILNGGTTNSKRDFNGISQGSLNQIADSLADNDIQFAYFNEPNLNDALTAVCFIVDERVFNYDDYPDFKDYLIDKMGFLKFKDYDKIRKKKGETLKEAFGLSYIEWAENVMGGPNNAFLRELLKGKKLA